jgi:hypothetical protein
MHGHKVNVKVLLRAFYNLTAVSLGLSAFKFSNSTTKIELDKQ